VAARSVERTRRLAGRSAADAMTPSRAIAVARAATARLATLVNPDGRFLYRYLLNDPTVTSPVYSAVRHVAAVWALADAEREGWDIPDLPGAIDRAAGYMEERLFRPFGSTNALCVLDEGFIKLGGSALGVVAEAALLRRDGKDERRDRIARLARHVASQREADGDYLPARIPGPIARPYPRRDDFTPGQAVMALAIAGEATGEAGLLDLAVHSAEAFARRGYQVGRTAHWMLYALEVLDRLRPSDAWHAYARRLAAEVVTLPLPAESMPIACMSEGLLALARMLRSRGGSEEEVANLLGKVAANLARQYRFFHPSGAFVMSAERHEVRIDTIQHNLLTFLGYARLAEVADRSSARPRQPPIPPV
jgi:hypothetical protein